MVEREKNESFKYSKYENCHNPHPEIEGPPVSHTFSLDDIKEAFDVQCKADESVKILVVP